MDDAPPRANIVSSKWVFKIKKDSGKHIMQRKAKLVAQGFSQVPGIDYFDTFALIVKLVLIQTILAIVTQLDLELKQIDIKGAYLNGELEPGKVIYMQHSPGYKLLNTGAQVLKLCKTLYELKQSD